MTDRAMHTDINPGAAVAEKLLYLYECVTEHVHLEKLIRLVGDLLRCEDDARLALPKLERHSKAALAAVSAQLSTLQHSSHISAEAYSELRFDPSVRNWLTEVEARIDGHFHADAAHTLTQWISGDDEFLVLPVVGTEQGNSLCFLQRLQCTTGTIGIRIWRDDYRISTAIEALLRENLQVTDSEILVLRQIGIGGKVSEIAEALGKSVETIRSQIKSLSNKLGVSSQTRIASELRKLEHLHAKAQHRPRTERTAKHHFMTEDGRRIAYSVYGAEEGRPVLFFHCCTQGRHLPSSLDLPLRLAGLRIISPSRAGYGRSSLHDVPPEDLLTASARDHAQLIRHLNLGKCHLLTQGTGLAHAFRFALLYPECVGKIVVLDGVPPATQDEDVAQFKGLFRDMVVTMRNAPHTFALITNLVLLRLTSFTDPTKRARRHFLYPKVDLQTVETCEGIAASTLNVRDLMRNQLAPSFADANIYRDDWSRVCSGSNLTPLMSFIHTRDNPFVTEEGTRAFARQYDAPVFSDVETFPAMSAQIDVISAELTRP